MRFFTVISLGLVLGVSAATADAGAHGSYKFDLGSHLWSPEQTSVFANDRARSIAKANARLNRADRARVLAEGETYIPSQTLGPSSTAGDLDGPNGELWFYTADFDYEVIPPHDDIAYYDYILQSYSFNIYNAKLELVGTVKDKVTYAEGEVRVPRCELAPIVTRNFFNTDDKYEVMVSLSINTNSYTNNYRTLVYSLGGEKDSDGNNQAISTLYSMLADVAVGPETADGKDNVYMTFADEAYGDDSESSFWDYLIGYHMAVNIYHNAINDTEGPVKIFSDEIPMMQVQGNNGENIPFLMSKKQGDNIYYIIPRYAEPFYNQYDDPLSDDMSQREGNSLEIKVYKANADGLNLIQTTSIAAPKDTSDDTVIASYYSVGNMRYTGDVTISNDGKVESFYITRENYISSSDDYENSYYTYNADGTLRHTLFEGADSSTAMSDLPGTDPQQLFIEYGAAGYIFNFINLTTGKRDFRLNYQYYIDADSEPETLTANIDRVASGDSYKYCCELRAPGVDDEENDIMRFIWFSDKGAYDHIDYVNMGKGIQYAQSYLNSEVLKPGVYTTDGMAYMILVKHALDGTSNQEELIIATPSTDTEKSKELLRLTPDERGILSSISPVFDGSNPYLMVGYYDEANSSVALDFYNLPLENNDHSGADSIVAADGELTIDGDTVIADGDIFVYTISGAVAASGNGSVDLGNLAKGVYIVVCGEKAHKVAVK